MWRNVLMFLVLAGPALADDPRFAPVDVPQHVYGGGWEHFVGGGLAGFDCDEDGALDLYAAGGEHPSMLLRNRSQPGGPVMFEADTPAALAVTGMTGAYPLDIDGDGHADLVLLRAGPNLFLKGDGQCGFTPFKGLNLFAGDRWTTAFSATWEAEQNLPTLAFGNYVNRDDPDGPFEACDTNMLLRPDGDTYDAPLTLAPGYCALSMLFSDWGHNGRADLRVSNDRHYYVHGGSEQMWAMEATPRLYGQADGWQTYNLWGMGIASRDVNGDGLSDVYLTSMADQKLQFLTSPDAPTFANAPFALGTTTQRPYQGDDGRPSTGWHVAFADVQNDGRDDIFVTKGNVDQMPSNAMEDPNSLLVQDEDGTFTEMGGAAGLASPVRSRGAVVADFNGDGLVDIAVVNRRAPMEIWQNVTERTGNWLSLTPRQDAPNTFAVGGWLELRGDGWSALREITVGGGHGGGMLGPQHFGLGSLTSVNARITWPDGAVSPWHEIAAGQALVARRKGDDFVTEPAENQG